MLLLCLTSLSVILIPRVRLEAVRGLTFSANEDSEFQLALMNAESASQRDNLQAARQQPERVLSVLRATDQPTDTFIDYAVWLSVRETASNWLPAFREGQLKFDNVDHIITAFSSVGQQAPVNLLLEQVFASSVTDEQRNRVVELILQSGNAAQIGQLTHQAVERGDISILRTIQARTLARGIAPLIESETASAMANHENAAVRELALKTIGQWRLGNYSQRLKAIVEASDSSPSQVAAALDGMALSKDAEMLKALKQQVGSQSLLPALRVNALMLLSQQQPHQAAQLVPGLLGQVSVNDQPGRIITAFLSQKNGQQILSESLTSATIDADIGRDLLKSLRESGQSAAQLETIIMKNANLTSRKSMTPEQTAALLQLVTKSNAADGEQIYRSQKFGCLKCHAIGGAGGKVGPDMVSLGGSAQPDYLLESLLKPNAKVKENYHTVVVVTTDGKLQSGIQVSRSKEEIVVRNAEDQLVTIPSSDVEEVAQGLSLMPEGLVDVLTDNELASLVRFLSELGRTPEYTLSRKQLARTWDVMRETPEAAFRLRRTSYGQAATDDAAFQWDRRYSMVNGALPMSDIPQVSVRNRSAPGTRGVGFARCYLTVETPGKVALKVNDPAGLELRVNDVPVDMAETMTFDAQPGTLRLTFNVDQSQRTQPLEVELAEQQTTAVCRFAN